MEEESGDERSTLSIPRGTPSLGAEEPSLRGSPEEVNVRHSPPAQRRISQGKAEGEAGGKELAETGQRQRLPQPEARPRLWMHRPSSQCAVIIHEHRMPGTRQFKSRVWAQGLPSDGSTVSGAVDTDAGG